MMIGADLLLVVMVESPFAVLPLSAVWPDGVDPVDGSADPTFCIRTRFVGL